MLFNLIRLSKKYDMNLLMNDKSLIYECYRDQRKEITSGVNNVYPAGLYLCRLKEAPLS